MATWTSGSGRLRAWDLDPNDTKLESNNSLSGIITAISNTQIIIEDGGTIIIEGNFSISGAALQDFLGEQSDNLLDYPGLSGTVSSMTSYYSSLPEVLITNINLNIQVLGAYVNSDFFRGIFSGNDIINGNEYYNDQDTYPDGKWQFDGAGHSFNGNRLHGHDGNDILNGNRYVDSLWGDTGNDTLYGFAGNDFLYGGTANDSLEGGSGNDKLYGNTGNDNLNGGDGNDTLVAGSGADVLDGGADSDTADYSEFIKSFSVTLNGSTFSSLKFGAIKTDRLKNIENIMGGSGSDTIIGDLNPNILNGGAGHDHLDGGVGNDTLVGGAGNDIFVADSALDVITENLNSGTDTIRTALTAYSLATLPSVENLTYTGGLASTLIGNTAENLITGANGNDTLDGGDGNDTLDGGSGIDNLIGGAGNDTYIINHLLDLAVENDNEGIDHIKTSLQYFDLIDFDNVENLTYTGIGKTSLVGNDIDNNIIGGSGSDVMEGGGGSDELYGGDGMDILLGFYIYEDEDIDSPNSDLTSEILEYEKNNSVDKLYGGKGNDIYILDSWVNRSTILENADEGIDTIFGSVSTVAPTDTIPDHVENYTNDTSISNDGVYQYVTINGNDLNNIIKTSPDWSTYPETDDLDKLISWLFENLMLETINETKVSYEKFFGFGGRDTLLGGAGNDVLDGGADNDLLRGGLDQDILDGGTGSDTADYSDKTTAVNVTLNESTNTTVTVNGAAEDTIKNIENVTGGSGADQLTGDALANTLMGGGGVDNLNGGTGSDTLDGGTGADVMWGGAGHDVYYVDHVGDQTNEAISANNTADATGTDLVYSSVTHTLGNNLENLTLIGTAAINGTGNALANTLTGNSAVNTLIGGAGNDTLNGGLGKDMLTGGIGFDYFDFTSVLNETANVDTITDFNREDDYIRLDNAVMAGLGTTTGALTAAAFVSGAGRTKAADSFDRIIYNTRTGDLYYDADGTGSSPAIKIALIGTSKRPVLDHTDFLII